MIYVAVAALVLALGWACRSAVFWMKARDKAVDEIVRLHRENGPLR